jgi:multiple sugar transport system permease protein
MRTRGTWPLLTPYLVGLVLLVGIPTLVVLTLALTEFDLVRPARWIGLANVTDLVADPIFRTALLNSLIFALVATPLRLLLALALALLLHRRGAATGAARTAAMLPTAMPEVAYGLLWLWLLNPVYGPINLLLTTGGAPGLTIFGRTPPQWLTDPTDARAAIILLSVFTIGESFVVLLAARRMLPASAYELAAIDDATGWDVFRRITLPLLSPVLMLLFLRDTVMGMQFSFIPALIITDGGPPPHATTYLSLFVYRNAFEYLRYGYAAAATAVMLGLTALVIAIQWLIVRRYLPRASAA